MKIFLISVVMLLGILPAFGQSFSYTYEGQTLTYVITDEESKTVRVSNSEPISGVLVLPENPIAGNVTYTLTEIGAFRNCPELTSVTIPRSLTTLGSNAFTGRTGLKEVYFNAENCTKSGSTWGESAFPSTIETMIFGEGVKLIPYYILYGCTGLKSVVIPNTVTKISDGAFYGCTSLTSVSIPDSVKEIGYGVFYFCSSLTSISIPTSVSIIGQHAFVGCSNLTSVSILGNAIIGKDAFTGCSNLTSVSILGNEITIEDRAFNGCTGLTSVNINKLEHWLNIDFASNTSNPLYYAKKLMVGDEAVRRLTIPEGTTRIKPYAFTGCEMITVTIPSSVTSVGTSVFSDCTNLQRIIFQEESALFRMHYDNENSYLKSGNNANLYIGSEIYAPKDLAFPEWMTDIQPYAFLHWSSLESVTIPEFIDSIGTEAFGACKNLKNVNMYNKVIGTYAFAGCERLDDVMINNHIDFIGSYAFGSCYGIKNFTIKEGVDSIADEAFSDWVGGPSAIIGSFRIGNLNDWARVKFGTYTSNPIMCASYLYAGEGANPVHNLVVEGTKPISAYAFCGAKGINRVRIKNGATVGAEAFAGSYSLTDICVISSIIGEKAFASQNIKNVYVPLSTPPSAPDNAFSNYDGVNLYVPKGAVSAYENATGCWWQFMNIYECDFSDIDTLFAPDYVNSESGICDITIGSTSNAYPDAIYNMQGVCLKQHPTQSDIDALIPGIYIINGKKVMVK